MSVKTRENGFHFDAKNEDFSATIPSAAIIWSNVETVYALNESAQRLIGFSEAELSAEGGFWSKRVYCSDRPIFAERQKKMESGATEITCDYRFYPKGSSEPILIREIIFSLRDPTGESKWISMYSDISDLQRSSSEDRDGFVKEEIRKFIACLFHEIKNRLHLLSMELELAALEPGENFNLQKFASTLHELNHSIKELHNYLIPTQNGQASPD